MPNDINRHIYTVKVKDNSDKRYSFDDYNEVN